MWGALLHHRLMAGDMSNRAGWKEAKMGAGLRMQQLLHEHLSMDRSTQARWECGVAVQSQSRRAHWALSEKRAGTSHPANQRWLLTVPSECRRTGPGHCHPQADQPHWSPLVPAFVP